MLRRFDTLMLFDHQRAAQRLADLSNTIRKIGDDSTEG